MKEKQLNLFIVCSRCKQTKTQKNFYSSIDSKSGCSSYCKECFKEYHKSNHGKNNKAKKVALKYRDQFREMPKPWLRQTQV